MSPYWGGGGGGGGGGAGYLNELHEKILKLQIVK